ncbi:transketolase family protein [Vampirovibrio chlorellavorus]|uniref:transketolase family protein n=1 Tax=Vampirovibrio chlorellavorus TaxID=758823 RepID=UPI0026EADA4E|nr:transketolase family protein [Vampirovibrio chlorellavorus]
MTAINLEKPELKALRNQYGETLAALGAENPNIVVLDADLACSTQTQKFADKFPERFFNQGISEQDLINTAAGLSTAGKIPFCSTFALFAAGKGWDQIRNTVCYSGLNVKICPTHSGLSLGEDGASHQSIEDIALMRVIPGMTVIVPSDAVETDRVIRWAAEYYGPVYVRLVRPNCPVIHDDASYQLDAAMPHRIRIERGGDDITLVATGETVYHALLAAERLHKDHGIQVEVLNCLFIKPFDSETLAKSARKTGKVITVESHQVMGGLAGVVCEELSTHQPTPVRRLGTQDRFGQSGTGDALFKEYGIDWEAIYNEAVCWLKS